MNDKGIFGLYIGGVFLVIVLLIDSVVPALSRVNPHDLEVGRYEIEDGYIIDTITGQIEKIDVWIKSYPQGKFRAEGRISSWASCPPPIKPDSNK